MTSIEVEAPFVFDAPTARSDVPDFLDSEWSGLGQDPDVVFSLPGRDANFARDLLIGLSKFHHVLDCAERARVRGALTWTLVDAYHAAMLGGRVLSSFYGVLSYTIRGRTVLMDYRPELGSADDQKQFARDHRGVDGPVRLLRPAKEKLDQKEAWALLRRLSAINSTGRGSEDRHLADEISDVTRVALSSVRNRILYDSVYWTWNRDFDASEHDESLLAAAFSSNDEAVSRLLVSLAKIREAVNRYSAELLVHLAVDIAQFPRLSAPTMLTLT